MFQREHHRRIARVRLVAARPLPCCMESFVNRLISTFLCPIGRAIEGCGRGSAGRAA